jgi:hypothetical protein
VWFTGALIIGAVARSKYGADQEEATQVDPSQTIWPDVVAKKKPGQVPRPVYWAIDVWVSLIRPTVCAGATDLRGEWCRPYRADDATNATIGTRLRGPSICP